MSAPVFCINRIIVAMTIRIVNKQCVTRTNGYRDVLSIAGFRNSTADLLDWFRRIKELNNT